MVLVALIGRDAIPVFSAPPQGFQDNTFIIGLTEPTGLTFVRDGRMFIIERRGKIKIVQAGATATDTTPLLQLTNINIDQGERGLVGITPDPGFATNGYIYTFYTANSPLRDRVSRWTVTGNTISLASELVIWEDVVDASLWHHGGTVAFGPDSKLYISTGYNDDTASGTSNGAQRLNSYHGKILRINGDGTIPTDNPFFDGAGPNLDAI
jgi:glucose/arabinose dehydrogenase